MKHPESAEWMAFLYGEVDGEQRANLDAHLAVCPDCVRRLARWRETMGDLDSAGVPERKLPSRVWFPAFRWAAAAAVILGLGFALGRQGLVSPRQIEERLETLRTQVRQDLAAQRDLDLEQVALAAVEVNRAENRAALQEFLRQYQTVRLEDRRALLAELQAMDRRHGTETARLREGLASLASSTGTGFEQTQTQMRLLAGNLEADGISNLNEPTDPNQEP